VAYRHLNLRNGRRVVIADAPGHEQYTRNMAVAASNADIAFLLVDAARGVRPQTHRHLTVCALMGVRSIVLAINKLDAVGFEQSAFDALVEEVMATARRLELADVSAIPVSALDGDNVVDRSERTSWYDGPTVLEYLEQWTPAAPAEDQRCACRCS
jgi:bifunctional enzyme CysN/CysC